MRKTHLCKTDYENIKDLVGMKTAAEFYGFPVGRNGCCICPFHQDRRPSMRIYPHNRGYYCFSCGSGGDVIKFVSRLFGLNNEQAAVKLIEDFLLPIQTEGLTYRERREREKKIRLQKKQDQWIAQAEDTLRIYWILLCEASRNFADPNFDEALMRLSYIEYRIKCLQDDPREFYEDREAVRMIGKVRERINSWYD